ncbi:MAG: TRAP transporter substrate-binding protein [candidate division WOR-3 bacterium]
MARGEGRALLFFLLVLTTLLFTAGLVGDVSAQAPAKPIKLTYALFQPATAALSKVQTEFAQELEKRTNGRVQIQVMQGGSLLGAPAMFQGIKNGIADMGNGITSYSPGNFPFSSIAELPSAGQSGWAVSYAMYDFVTKYQPKEWDGVHLLTTVGTGADAMGLGMGKTPVRKLEDLKGKSIRTNHADITAALGATIKDVPMAEVFDAVSKGVLDGVHGSLEPFRSWKLADVCKHVTVNTAPLQPSIMWYNIMNKAKWNSLPPDIQKIFTEVSKEYMGKLGLTWDDQGVAGVEYSKSVGSSVYFLPKEEAARWQAAIAPVVDARIKALVSKGLNKKDVDDAWAFFKSRVEYWNGQQAKHNVTPLLARIQKISK